MPLRAGLPSRPGSMPYQGLTEGNVYSPTETFAGCRRRGRKYLCVSLWRVNYDSGELA